jgi:hypothetical protein
MEFNADRLQYLAGVTGLDNYRTAVLAESRNINELDVTLTLEPADKTEAEEIDALVGDLEVDLEVEEPLVAVEIAPEEEVEVEVGEEETVAEARLRRAIRREIQAVLGETRIEQSERNFKQARRDKSIASAMGWNNWASGRVHSSRKNARTSRGPGRSVGFGGPGFM